eukprot:GEMP01008718.1.p1 GENE.GEMP01008718.1~~GEMP01008718.1.p1  ORF type:complete len:940 (+),score=171.99 GEMP01008718.1:42-2861(+)
MRTLCFVLSAVAQHTVNENAPICVNWFGMKDVSWEAIPTATYLEDNQGIGRMNGNLCNYELTAPYGLNMCMTYDPVSKALALCGGDNCFHGECVPHYEGYCRTEEELTKWLPPAFIVNEKHECEQKCLDDAECVAYTFIDNVEKDSEDEKVEQNCYKYRQVVVDGEVKPYANGGKQGTRCMGCLYPDKAKAMCFMRDPSKPVLADDGQDMDHRVVGAVHTLFDTLGTVLFAPDRDIITSNLGGGSNLYINLPEYCYARMANTVSSKNMFVMSNVEDVLDRFGLEVSIDVSGNSGETTGKATFKSRFSKSTSTHKSIQATLLDNKHMVSQYFINQGCLKTDLIEPSIVQDFENLPVDIPTMEPARDSREWQVSWQKYDDFLRLRGSHIITDVYTGARVQYWLKRVADTTKSEKELKIDGCAYFSKMGEGSVDACIGVSTRNENNKQFSEYTSEIIAQGGDPDASIDLVEGGKEEEHNNIANFLKTADDQAAIKVTWQPVWRYLAALKSDADWKKKVHNMNYFYHHLINQIGYPDCVHRLLNGMTTEDCQCGREHVCRTTSICDRTANDGAGICWTDCNKGKCGIRTDCLNTMYRIGLNKPRCGSPPEATYCCKKHGQEKVVNIQATKKKNKPGCVGGTMKVTFANRTDVTVANLQVNDTLLGADGVEVRPNANCRVLAVNRVADRAPTLNGFTPDHFVLDKATHMVVPYENSTGMVSSAAVEPIYTLATTCDLVRNANGDMFTPLSTQFCRRDLKLPTYVKLMDTIINAMKTLGAFWFDLDIYQDNSNAAIPRWMDQLPTLCEVMIKCVEDDECMEFELVSSSFIRDHVREAEREYVLALLPRLGEPDDDNAIPDVMSSKLDTLSRLVRKNKHTHYHHAIFVKVMGCGMLIIVSCFIAFGLLVWRRRSNASKEKRLAAARNQSPHGVERAVRMSCSGTHV